MSDSRMVRSKLMEQLVQKFPHLPPKDVAAAANMILEEMEDALCQMWRIEFRGFGSWEIRKRAKRIAHNPLTGKKVSTSEKFRAHFKPGKSLRQRVDHGKDKYQIQLNGRKKRNAEEVV